MAKSPARLNDEVVSIAYGTGKIASSSTNVTFDKKLVACADDFVEFDEGAGSIMAGGACVMVGGKRLALNLDTTHGAGIIYSSCTSIAVDEGNPCIFIGSQVAVGENVIFHSHSQTNDQANDIKYDYYLVNSRGNKAKLAVFNFNWLLSDLYNIDIDEYFERETWQNESTNQNIPMAVNNPTKPLMLAALGVGSNIFYKTTTRKYLLDFLKTLHPSLRSQIPANEGLLLMAQYQERELTIDTVILYDIDIIGVYSDPEYQTEIKKILSEPAFLSESRPGYEWKYLFIWATQQ